ncbi:hypothetical protein SHO565_70880 [Streptomyces sp. HO565]
MVLRQPAGPAGPGERVYGWVLHRAIVAPADLARYGTNQTGPPRDLSRRRTRRLIV